MKGQQGVGGSGTAKSMRSRKMHSQGRQNRLRGLRRHYGFMVQSVIFGRGLKSFYITSVKIPS